jgi:hypothetical protein
VGKSLSLEKVLFHPFHATQKTNWLKNSKPVMYKKSQSLSISFSRFQALGLLSQETIIIVASCFSIDQSLTNTQEAEAQTPHTKR